MLLLILRKKCVQWLQQASSKLDWDSATLRCLCHKLRPVGMGSRTKVLAILKSFAVLAAVSICTVISGCRGWTAVNRVGHVLLVELAIGLFETAAQLVTPWGFALGILPLQRLGAGSQTRHLNETLHKMAGITCPRTLMPLAAGLANNACANDARRNAVTHVVAAYGLERSIYLSAQTVWHISNGTVTSCKSLNKRSLDNTRPT